MKTLENCSGYQGCEAPLCPLSEELEDAVYYLNEPICSAREFQKLHWIKIQRRLRKYKAKDGGYFTKEMLSNIRRCTPMTKGINPDGRTARQGDPYNPRISEKVPSKALKEGYRGHNKGNWSRKQNQLVLI